MVRKTIKFGSIVVLAAVLVGCDPDDIEFSVTTDVLCAAMNGKVGESECIITFNISAASDKFKSKIPAVKKRILPLLGDNGKINVLGDRLVASFKAKVVCMDGVIVGKEGPYRIVVANDGVTTYQATCSLLNINKELKEVGVCCFDDDPKQVTWRLSAIENSATVCAMAVFVDGVGKLIYKEVIAEKNEREIVFSRNKHSVYSQVPVSFSIAK